MKVNILGINWDKYNVLTMFANVYPVIYFDIFGDSFGPGMTALHASKFVRLQTNFSSV